MSSSHHPLVCWSMRDPTIFSHSFLIRNCEEYMEFITFKTRIVAAVAILTVQVHLYTDVVDHDLWHLERTNPVNRLPRDPKLIEIVCNRLGWSTPLSAGTPPPPPPIEKYGEVRLMIRDDDTEIRIHEKRTPPMGERRKRKIVCGKNKRAADGDGAGRDRNELSGS
ncbi:hypothetical protein CDAR_127541 [Caerostris darwini]|uniref:Uncharacterized protein n=1 Tax=Caerostris darwini TaxID=1538125 RepID=A0AAV4UWD0_9ARAC|nr:hypothetical protein CDAR_127541 [Caerostris darwini]